MNSTEVRQVSGEDADGQPVLSVLAKRRYRLEGGRPVDGEDAPLTEAVVRSEASPELLIADTDLYAFKPLTDIVVQGTAHPPHVGVEFEASVQVGASVKRVVVLGRRRVLRSGSFGSPEDIEPTPLSYAQAFGGADDVYLRRVGHPMEAIRAELEERPEILAENPFAYPRNPCGVGFAMVESSSRERDTSEELPRFEDPEDRLTPERRFAGPDFAWARLPAPAGLSWFGLLWFPRCLFFGIVPDIEDAKNVPEALAGVVDPAILAKGARFCQPDPRSACGASPGLSVPWLTGGETLLLENLSRHKPRLEVTLPNAPATMRVDGRKGKLTDTQPVISSVVVEPDEGTLTIVWRGTGVALRLYGDEELARMPFEVLW
jgi:hypothetical protein